jgi:hypothetical protein
VPDLNRDQLGRAQAGVVGGGRQRPVAQAREIVAAGVEQARMLSPRGVSRSTSLTGPLIRSGRAWRWAVPSRRRMAARRNLTSLCLVGLASSSRLVVVVGIVASRSRVPFKAVVSHRGRHDLECGILFCEFDCEGQSVELGMQPEAAVLVHSEREWLRQGARVSLGEAHQSSSLRHECDEPWALAGDVEFRTPPSRAV